MAPHGQDPDSILGERPNLRGRVLIVDDEAELLAEMAETLRRAGFAVEAASLPRDAVEIVMRAPAPDVVVSDIRMPEIGGLDLIGILKARLPEAEITQFVVITGAPALDTVVSSMRAGAIDFLCKPLKRAELVGAVNAAALRAQKARQLREGRDMALHLRAQMDELLAQLKAPAGGPRARTIDAGMLRLILKARARREAIFGPELMAEPGWDILLDLASAKLAGEELSVTAVCIGSRASMTTALRRINDMVARGLVIRRPDPHDRRRQLVELTDQGFARLLDYLAEVNLEAML